MSENQNYRIPELSTEAVTQSLAGCSPLAASKTLIDMELFDQRSSLEVLNTVYAEFDSGANIIEQLVTPIGLNVLDSIISHKKLKLNRTGITASRVWAEINNFSYPSVAANGDALSAKQQLDAMRKPDKFEREKVAKRDLGATKDTFFADKDTAQADIEVNQQGQRVKIYRSQEQDGADWVSAAQTDHIVPVKQLADQYGKNAFLVEHDRLNKNGEKRLGKDGKPLKISDLSRIVDSDDNLSQISGELNNLKSDSSYAELKQLKAQAQQKQAKGEALSSKEQRLLKVNDQTLDNGIAAEQKSADKALSKAQQAAWDNLKSSKAKVASKAGKQAGEQSAHQALGHAFIALIKPLFYELNDAIKHGLAEGVDASSIAEGLKLRFARISQYLKQQVLPTLGKVVKDFISNLFKVLIEGILGLVTGLFKSVMRIISEGFSAMIGAFKILTTPAEQMSAAQKGDAILKLFASTVVTFVVFYFETSILSFLPDDGFIKDIALALLSGVASTIVVYLLDKADLFSVKAELRSQRVAEVFDFRIEQIKRNTDAFESASIQSLAEQKLQFRQLNENLVKGIASNQDVNSNVYDLASFFKVELDIKNNDDFLAMLETSKVVTI